MGGPGHRFRRLFRFGSTGPEVVDRAVDQPPGVPGCGPERMSVSGQMITGWAGGHVRYSEAMSGSVDVFSLGCTQQSREGRRS